MKTQTSPAFIAGIIYRAKHGTAQGSRAKFDCFMATATGDFYIADCWICDRDGNIDPGFNVSPVPVIRATLGRVVGNAKIAA